MPSRYKPYLYIDSVSVSSLVSLCPLLLFRAIVSAYCLSCVVVPCFPWYAMACRGFLSYLGDGVPFVALGVRSLVLSCYLLKPLKPVRLSPLSVLCFGLCGGFPCFLLFAIGLRGFCGVCVNVWRVAISLNSMFKLFNTRVLFLYRPAVCVSLVFAGFPSVRGVPLCGSVCPVAGFTSWGRVFVCFLGFCPLCLPCVPCFLGWFCLFFLL